jgi:16S rRNA pseudouridine516 synthase
MRLDKYLTAACDMTRKQARAAIRAGDVTVDDARVTAPGWHVATDSRVALSGQALASPAGRYFMLHKPEGYICATRDGHRPTVLDLLDEPNRERLQIVGRLDRDTTGLLLLTDDGQWNHQVTSPRKDCGKVYLLETATPIDPGAIEVFERGIVLQPENCRTRPARLVILSPQRAQLTISEGRYHQVKRMMAAVGSEVIRLHRSAIGAILLDDGLAPGRYRPLTATEIESVG